MLKDILGQAWEAMLFNRRRTAITMIGMAWGIATVVLLLAYGAGFSRALEAIFAEWGTNTIGVFPGRTSQQAGGDKAGVRVRFTLDDVDRVCRRRSRNRPYLARGVEGRRRAERSAHLHLERKRRPPGVPGHHEDGHRSGPLLQWRRGPAARPRLRHRLGGQDQALLRRLGAWAKTFASTARSFTVVGVLQPKMQESDDDINRQIYIPFNTMSDLKDTQYVDGIWFSYTGDNQLAEKGLRETLAAAHHFRPSDHNAIYVANLMTAAAPVQILSLALQVLLSLVGALTLGIAGIGLMNIMLVAVQQRTREIGVEKALGARRRHILVQFLAEAMAITGVGGLAGILLAYLISVDGRPHPVLQRPGATRRGCRHPPPHLSRLGDYLHCDPRHHRPGQRNDSRHPRSQPGPHRGAALRVIENGKPPPLTRAAANDRLVQQQG